MTKPMSNPPLTAERLRQILTYAPETGDMRWRVRTNSRICVGNVAGSINSQGYRQIRIAGRLYKAHRLAWLHVYSQWPVDQIDHKNGVRSDNRISNLRQATRAENGQNLAPHPRNKSGYPGVDWHIGKKKWQARITVDRKELHLGYFDERDDAVAARRTAKAKYHTFQPVDRSA